MIAEDQFRQNMEEFNPMAALLGMDVTLRREVHQERARINELIVNQQRRRLARFREIDALTAHDGAFKWKPLIGQR